MTAFAQTNIKLSGSVYDAFDRQILVGARIKIDNSSFTAITDQFGNYEISGIPTGEYLITIECDGYLSLTGDRVEISEDIASREDFYLARKVYLTDDILVRGTASPLLIDGLEVLSRTEISESSSRDVAELLDNINGIYVQESGQKGGESRISIRGCDPRHVLILLDGHKINNSSGGQANLSEIPLEAVDRIEIYKGGGSARFGGQGMGGVINILTGGASGAVSLEPKVVTRKGWGKWKTSELGLALYDVVPVMNLTTKFVYNTESSNGDFDYNYTGVSPRPALIRPVVGVRSNDRFERESYFVSGRDVISPVTQFQFSGQLSKATAGIPGPVGDVDSTAFKEEDKAFFSSQVNRRISNRLKGSLSAGYVRLIQYFNNLRNLRAAERYEDRFRNDRFEGRADLNFVATTANQISGGIVLERDLLYHDNLYRPTFGNGRTTRDNLGIYITDRQSWAVSAVPLVRLAVLNVSIRSDFTSIKNRPYEVSDTTTLSSETSKFLSPKVGFSVVSEPTDRARVTLRGSYGKSYQLPDLNALFWKGNVRSSGNPELLPEKSEHSDIGLEFVREGRVNLSAGVTYFHSYIKDIIIWKRSSPLGVWQPANEKAAQITGHEEFVELSFFGRRFELSYRNQITNPINKHNGGKILTYRPQYITRYEAAFELGPLSSVYKVRLVDRRYLTEVNSKYDDSYRLDDWEITLEQKVGPVAFKSTWELNNLRDEEYVLIKRYPMPGRNWSVRMSLTYNLSRD